MAAPQSPDDCIHPVLLHHLHLTSTVLPSRQQQLNHQQIFAALHRAPQIFSEQPVVWRMLDCPPEGALLYCWQSRRLGSSFPTDGFVWFDGENHSTVEINGYQMDVVVQRAGYKHGETSARYTRTRFRLRHAGQLHGALEQLWLVQYVIAPQNDWIPTSRFPQLPPNYSQLLHRHRQLAQSGHIRPLPFPINDSARWPRINLPGATMQPGGPTPAQMRAMRRGPPPSKRPRHGTNQGMPPPQHQQQQESIAHDPAHRQHMIMSTFPMEDQFDVLSNRDIAIDRYQRNHRFMEELLEGRPSMSDITPHNLGFGLKGGIKGDLSELTAGILDEPIVPGKEGQAAKPAIVNGHLAPEKKAELERRYQALLDRTSSELADQRAKTKTELEQFRQRSEIYSMTDRLRRAQYAQGGIWEKMKEELSPAQQQKVIQPAGVIETVQDVREATERLLKMKVRAWRDRKVVMLTPNQPGAEEMLRRETMKRERPPPPPPQPQSAKQPDEDWVMVNGKGQTETGEQAQPVQQSHEQTKAVEPALVQQIAQAAEGQDAGEFNVEDDGALLGDNDAFDSFGDALHGMDSAIGDGEMDVDMAQSASNSAASSTPVGGQ